MKGLTPPALLVAGIGGLIAATTVGLGGCTSDSPPPPPRHTITVDPSAISVAPPSPSWMPMPPPGPVDHFGDGVFEPVTDIVPGKYKTLGGDGSACYWARYKDLNRQITSMIASGYGNTGPDVIVIDPSDKAFESHGCGEWHRQP